MWPARKSSVASSASTFEVSTSVSSIAWRTPGFISVTNTRASNNAHSATMAKYPRKMRRPMRMSGRDRIPEAAMRADRIGGGIHGVQLRAQGLHVRVYGAVAAVERIAPHAIHELRAREHGTRALQQRGEQAVFVAREVEPLAAVTDAVTVGVV